MRSTVIRKETLLDSKQLKIGAILSYVLIAVNSIYGIIITPYILSTLGAGEYGVYRTIGSFAGSLMVLNLGIGSTVIRYVAKFNAEKNKRNIENFSAMCMIQAAIISLVIVAVSSVLYNLIDPTYSESFTVSEITKAKQLFIIYITNMCFHMFENVIFGIIVGCNRFAYSNSVKLLRVLLRIILIYSVLSIFRDSLVLVGIDLLITILTIFAELIYLNKVLLLRIKYYFWDKSLFIESFKYTSQLFIQSIAAQINGNLDNIVIGAVIGSGAVAVYSIGLLLFNMFEQFAVSLSDLMLPTVTNQIQAGANNRDLEDTVIKVGRLQFALLGAALAGFALVGQEFVNLWLGDSYKDVWLIAMVLMIPTTIPLIQNVCLSILRAKNKLTFRTWAVTFMAIFNLFITIIGVIYFGYIAAAIGTALGLICANIVAMNIYYYRVMKINVIRIFAGIFKRTIICLIIAAIGLAIANMFIYGSWVSFLVKVIIFCFIYGSSMYIYGFSKSEKNMLFGFISKRRRLRNEN